MYYQQFGCQVLLGCLCDALKVELKQHHSVHSAMSKWVKVLGQALLAENQASAEGMRYLQVMP